jgi:hypothetical protein
MADAEREAEARHMLCHPDIDRVGTTALIAWRDSVVAWLDVLAGDLDEAEHRATQALHQLRRAGNEVFAATASGTLSWVAAFRRDLEANERWLHEGLVSSRRRRSATYSAAQVAALSGLAARKGHLEEADAHYAEAAAMLGDGQPEDLRQGVALSRGLIELARARAAADPSVAGALRDGVRAQLEEAARPTQRSSYVRLMWRLVHEELERDTSVP